MNAIAGLAQLADDVSESRDQVVELLRGDALTMAFHPVLRLESREMLGTEALARIAAPPDRSPREWFALAQDVGLLTALEVLAIRQALTALPQLPDGAYLFINASPETLMTPEFHGAIPWGIADRLIIDLGVDGSIASYSKFIEVVSGLRAAGLRISIDDAGDDRASWSRVTRLEPEIIKLRPALTRGLISDPQARAVARNFLAFAADIHADVVAEAIETEDECAMLIDLGVQLGQGFLFGKPAPLA